ncbi:hypothetical protein ABEB36_005866 [Hypothenemus hampei]|uniref:Uncharacterized protein n=1 Tax=Hypothenemus hampei TaxID=57062 RepID=A0ABD1F043_HYPHA
MKKKDWIQIYDNFNHSSRLLKENSITWDSSDSDHSEERNHDPDHRCFPTINKSKSMVSTTNESSVTSDSEMEHSPIVKVKRINWSRGETCIKKRNLSPVIETKMKRIKDNLTCQRHIKSDTLSELSTNTSTLEKIYQNDSSIQSVDGVYNQPKKKKSYKKGSIAAQLQKTIRQARLRKSVLLDDNRDKLFYKEQEIIKVKCKHFRLEYGVTLMECELLNPDICTIFPACNVDFNFCDNYCVINLGRDKVLNKVILEIECLYELYPPYDFLKLRKFKVYHS